MKIYRRSPFLLILVSLLFVSCNIVEEFAAPVEPITQVASEAPSAALPKEFPTATLPARQEEIASTPDPSILPTETPRPYPSASPTNEAYLEHYERGKALSEVEGLAPSLDLARAIDEFNKAIDLKPAFADAYAARAGAYLDLEELEKARIDAERAIELDPENDQAYDIKGFVYLLQEAYELALVNFDQAIALNPQGGRIYYHRGQAKFFLGDSEGSLADYSRALELDPESPAILDSRGRVYLDLGHYEEALADIDRAITLDGEDAELLYHRGLIMRSLDDLEEALAAYDQTIELDPKFTSAYHKRAKIYSDLGELDKALADYDRVLALDPYDARGFTNRGATHYALGDWNAALADYSQAIELDPYFAWAYQKRAEYHLISGNPEQAYDDFSQAISLDPGYAPLITGRGRTLAILQRYEESLEELAQALDLEPGNQYPNYLIGLTYLEMGDTESALDQFDQLLEQVENSTAFGNASTGRSGTTYSSDLPTEAALGRFGRGRVYMAMDQVENALTDFRQASQHDSDPIVPEIDILLNNGRGEDYLYLIRGLILAGTGDREASVADYQQAMDAEVDLEIISHFLHERSRVSSAQGEIETAIIDLGQAISLSPNKAGMYFDLGMLFLDSGEMEEAVDSFSDALNDQPDYINALYYRGYAQGELGNLEQAGDDLCRSLEMMDEQYAAGEVSGGDFIELDDLMSILSRLEIDCNLPES